MTSHFSLPDFANLAPNPEMASLPMFDRLGWKRVRFGDVVENLNETCDPMAEGLERFVAMEHLEPGSLHVRSWGNVADGTTFTRRCCPGQVLFGKRRAYQRKVAVAEFDAVVSGDIYILAPKDDRLLTELLPFVCLSEKVFEYAVGTSAGSLSPRTNWGSLASFELELPPLERQQRMAEIFWAVDEAKEAVRKIAADCHELKSRLLDDLLADKSNRMIRVGEIAKFTSGKTISVTGLSKDPSSECRIPVYGGNGVSGFTSTPLLDNETVVIGRVGQFCGAVFVTSGPSWVTDNALMISRLDQDVNLHYLALCLGASRLNQRKIGNYLPLINQKVVHETRIPIPTEVAQARIVDKFSKIEEQISSVSVHASMLRELSTNFCNLLVT